MVSPSGQVAIGYVSAFDDDVLNRQRDLISAHAHAEGATLVQIITDRFDGFTISQVREAVRRHDARLVIVPADTSLAAARLSLAQELESLDAACAVIDATPRTGPGSTSPVGVTAGRTQPRHARTRP